ncbi:MAG: amino acid-binding protein [Eggerthellaceae bacterium]|nr:amino acid-binding protein [Eggerthellaceae bacterium]
MISQVTIFLENRKGHLARACRAIADAGVNMRALFLADTADFGIARIFCDRPEFTVRALGEAGFRAMVTPVLAVHVPNREGALAALLEFLDKEEVNVEYSYCFSVNDDAAINVLKVGDSGIEGRLADAGYQIAKEEEVYALG